MAAVLRSYEEIKDIEASSFLNVLLVISNTNTTDLDQAIHQQR